MVLRSGSTATAKVLVTKSELASSLFETTDLFPMVYATSRMIALMELAAARVLRPFLDPDELSVGVAVDVPHTAATPPGAIVTATARFMGREGSLYKFEVWAEDDAGEIGRGTHKRAIVSTSRLVEGAVRRRKK